MTLPPPPQFPINDEINNERDNKRDEGENDEINNKKEIMKRMKLGGRGKCHKPERDENEESEGNGRDRRKSSSNVTIYHFVTSKIIVEKLHFYFQLVPH